MIWYIATTGRDISGGDSTGVDIEPEAEWIETTLTVTLDAFVISLRVTAPSKNW